MITIGLTGSIGMGKSTVAAMFAAEEIPVWSADEAVRQLYRAGEAGAERVAARFPAAIVEGAVDRDRLSALVLEDAAAFAELEEIIHPLVAADRARVLTQAAKDGADLAILEIPLLFEKRSEKYFDAIIVVSAPADVQKRRVLARPGMSERMFRSLLMKQTPDAEKRRRADYVIDTGVSLDETRAAVRAVLADIKLRFRIA